MLFPQSDRPRIDVDGKSREDARKVMLSLARNQEFLVYTSQRTEQPFEVWIRTDGTKPGEEGDDIQRKSVPVNRDFTVHYTGETGNLSFVDDFLVDIKLKQTVLHERKVEADAVREWTTALLDSILQSIELKPVPSIIDSHPILTRFPDLPGHPVEMLLALIKWLGLEEDVNYWGTKYRKEKKTKKIRKAGHFDGRYKPIIALNEYFLEGATLQRVFKKHFAYY